ncbi:MAG: 30S ribosomal protein S12 methylthiotransferase RimO [Candidatus Eisenbacteria bacterium]|nr:30S ribosomal protein S12 methylthiotransferase RimO [Candidatus Eisenbacteria bacterium]
MREPNKNKVYILTLGCPKNDVDSEAMAGILAREGLEATDDPERADLIVVNTCTFIDEAKEESIEAILDAGAAKGGRKLLVTGCMAERYGAELMREMPEIDGVIGVRSLHLVGVEARRLLEGEDGGDTERALPAPDPDRIGEGRIPLGAKHTAYLKIAEGCGRTCTFCSIPSFRGTRLESRPAESLEREARALAARGARELVLVAQETTAWGRDLGEPAGLAGLIDRLAEVREVRWIRVLYGHPETVDDLLLDRLASGAACRYLDVPIQHVSDRMLRLMGRGMTGDDLRRKIARIRERAPEITLRSEIMVGFPGESEADFFELRNYIAETAFDRLGVFRFSPQEGTAATRLPDPVPEETARERHQELVTLQEEILEERGRRLVGARLDVMVDGGDEDGLWARSEADAPDIDGAVLIPGESAPAGTFLEVEITEAGGALLVARRRR